MSRRKLESAKVVSITGGKPIARKRPPPVQATRVAWLVGKTNCGVLVDFAGNREGPLLARASVPITADQLTAEPPTEVVLVFDGETRQPVIIGVVQDPLASSDPEEPLARPHGLQVDVDGNRVVLSANHEIVLQCGESQIILRRNGRVVIRGVYVETRSKGLNRIKGGAVHIN